MTQDCPPARRVDVVFVSPPAYYPWVIPPGLAYISGYLENLGVNTRVIDANILAIEYVLIKGSSAPGKTMNAITSLRDMSVIKDWRLYEKAVRHINECARKASGLANERLMFARNTVRYHPAYELRSREGLLNAARDWNKHLFTPWYVKSLVPHIRQTQPFIVAISASDLHQLLPATVMCAVLRHHLGETCPPLLLGGNVFSRIYESLSVRDKTNEALLGLWGTVVVGEGERSTYDAVQAVRKNQSIGEIDGILRLGSERPRKRMPISLNELAPPRCDGFLPLIPKKPIPLNIYRGCYYSGLCTFCDINQGYDSVWTTGSPNLTTERRRFRSLDLTIADIKTCIERYNTTLFNFTDEWFLARDMMALSEELLAQKVAIKWDAYCRFEPALTQPSTAKLLARAGAKFLQFGLESATLRTLKAIGKGILPQTSSNALRCLAQAGIWNHIFLIVGLPGEHLHEALLTIAFVLENAEYILTIKPTRFQLARHSPMGTTAQVPHIEVEQARMEEIDLALNQPFRYRRFKFCPRCMREASQPGTVCVSCKDQLVSRPYVSRRGVNLMYKGMELIAAKHWAYPFTSLYPYHNRMLFSSEEARHISSERSDLVDRNLGLSDAEIARTLQALCRCLQWEGRFVDDVRQIYQTAGIRPPAGWNNIGDLATFAQAWARACALPTISHAVA